MRHIRGGTLCAVLLLSGCSSDDDAWTKDLPATVSAGGIVLLDGQPLEGASIVFSPVAPGEHAASAVSGRGGEFELKAFPSKAGAVPGEYHIGVTKTVDVGPAAALKPEAFGEDAGHAESSPAPREYKNLIPAKFENAETSGLKAEIPEGGTTGLRIELKSSP